MFHRFTMRPESRIDRSGVVSGAFLDALLAYIRRRGGNIISLRDITGAIEERRQFICLTIDDGYRDNAEVALPVLRRYQAPATIFVPSAVLDRSLDAWWLQIEELARAEDNPPAAYDRMVAGVSRNPEILEQMREFFPIERTELNERYFMSAGEIRAIDQDPLIEIGGHTVSHPILGNLPEDEAFREIRQNKDDLEKLLDRPVEAFAYPYGHAPACGRREYTLANKAGYKVAVTTRDGNIMPDHKGHMTALPRYSVRGKLENIAIYGMQWSGTYRALKSRFGSPVVTE